MARHAHTAHTAAADGGVGRGWTAVRRRRTTGLEGLIGLVQRLAAQRAILAARNLSIGGVSGERGWRAPAGRTRSDGWTTVGRWPFMASRPQVSRWVGGRYDSLPRPVAPRRPRHLWRPSTAAAPDPPARPPPHPRRTQPGAAGRFHRPCRHRNRRHHRRRPSSCWLRKNRRVNPTCCRKGQRGMCPPQPHASTHAAQQPQAGRASFCIERTCGGGHRRE